MTFIDDVEKMTDLLTFMVEGGKWAEDFLRLYNYLSENELEDTVRAIDGVSLANLWRQAENIYIDELNGRGDPLSVTSEQIKSAITSFLNSGKLPEHEKECFYSACESMGC